MFTCERIYLCIATFFKTKEMKRLRRYSLGFLIGMCSEYLYRVESDVWYIPCGVVALGLILMVIDVTHD